MKRRRLVAGAMALALGAALMARTPGAAPPLDLAVVKADLRSVAKARILFAHQSVGRNILEGVHGLSTQLGVPIRIQDIGDAAPDAAPGLFHTLVGVNGDPDSKLAAFARLLDRPQRPSYDVAVLKFCYEDLARDARGRSGLLERYGSELAALQARHADIHVLPATAPLRADPSGWKTTLKRWLGRATEEDADNALRNAYNEGLRTRFRGVLFDIAAAESTLPDGSRSGFSAQGKTIPTLAAAYTSDGGHLNEEGRRRAAAAFLHALAQSLRQAR